jgi:hypothetical protein
MNDEAYQPVDFFMSALQVGGSTYKYYEPPLYHEIIKRRENCGYNF